MRAAACADTVRGRRQAPHTAGARTPRHLLHAPMIWLHAKMGRPLLAEGTVPDRIRPQVLHTQANHEGGLAAVCLHPAGHKACSCQLERVHKAWSCQPTTSRVTAWQGNACCKPVAWTERWWWRAPGYNRAAWSFPSTFPHRMRSRHRMCSCARIPGQLESHGAAWDCHARGHHCQQLLPCTLRRLPGTQHGLRPPCYTRVAMHTTHP